jgi:hypothetical protein
MDYRHPSFVRQVAAMVCAFALATAAAAPDRA